MVGYGGGVDWVEVEVDYLVELVYCGVYGGGELVEVECDVFIGILYYVLC